MKLYILPGCPWCHDAIQWLNKQGYSFELIDIKANPAAYQEMRTLSGQCRTPTLQTPAGQVLADFDVAALEKFLATQK